jgi:hypothetical protein
MIKKTIKDISKALLLATSLSYIGSYISSCGACNCGDKVKNVVSRVGNSNRYKIDYPKLTPYERNGALEEQRYFAISKFFENVDVSPDVNIFDLNDKEALEIRAYDIDLTPELLADDGSLHAFVVPKSYNKQNRTAELIIFLDNDLINTLREENKLNELEGLKKVNEKVYFFAKTVKFDEGVKIGAGRGIVVSILEKKVAGEEQPKIKYEAKEKQESQARVAMLKNPSTIENLIVREGNKIRVAECEESVPFSVLYLEKNEYVYSNTIDPNDDKPEMCIIKENWEPKQILYIFYDEEFRKRNPNFGIKWTRYYPYQKLTPCKTNIENFYVSAIEVERNVTRDSASVRFTVNYIREAEGLCE